MIMMMMMMMMKMMVVVVVVVVLVVVVIAWKARLCNGEKRQKKPGKIGSLSSPIFFLLFPPMQSLSCLYLVAFLLSIYILLYLL